MSTVSGMTSQTLQLCGCSTRCYKVTQCVYDNTYMLMSVASPVTAKYSIEPLLATGVYAARAAPISSFVNCAFSSFTYSNSKKG
jgi:hypothetical protein